MRVRKSPSGVGAPKRKVGETNWHIRMHRTLLSPLDLKLVSRGWLKTMGQLNNRGYRFGDEQLTSFASRRRVIDNELVNGPEKGRAIRCSHILRFNFTRELTRVGTREDCGHN